MVLLLKRNWKSIGNLFLWYISLKKFERTYICTKKKRQNFSCVSAFDGEYNKLVQKVTYYSYLCAVVNCIS